VRSGNVDAGYVAVSGDGAGLAGQLSKGRFYD